MVAILSIPIILLLLALSSTINAQPEPRCDITELHPGRTRINCIHIGADGKPLHEVLQKNLYLPIHRQTKNFTGIAPWVREIHVTADGHVKIPAHGLKGLDNLEDVEFFNPNSFNKAKYNLFIHANAFKNTPKLQGIGAIEFQFSDMAIKALNTLKEQLTKVKIQRCEPRSALLGFIQRCTKLEEIRLTGFKADDQPGPADVFSNSAGTLTHIYVSEWPLPDGKLTANVFSGMSNLAAFAWTKSNFTEIESGIFNQFSNLSFVDFYGNSIRQLPDGLFEHTKQLSHLDFRKNPIENLDRQNFKHLEKFDSLQFLIDEKPQPTTTVKTDEAATTKTMKTTTMKLDTTTTAAGDETAATSAEPTTAGEETTTTTKEATTTPAGDETPAEESEATTGEAETTTAAAEAETTAAAEAETTAAAEEETTAAAEAETTAAEEKEAEAS